MLPKVATYDRKGCELCKLKIATPRAPKLHPSFNDDIFVMKLFALITNGRLRLYCVRLLSDPCFLLFVLQNIVGYKNKIKCG